MKVLVSAYACEPNKGSEPGVGWNWSKQTARFTEAWVITRENNREVIEEELQRNPIPNLHFVYVDLPKWMRFWKKGGRGVRTYYCLWQIAAYKKAMELQASIRFDLAHHVTFVNDWLPSLFSFLSLPFVWGPIGSHPPFPRTFHPNLRSFLLENARLLLQNVLRCCNPFFYMALLKANRIIVIDKNTPKRFPFNILPPRKFISELAIAADYPKDHKDPAKDRGSISVISVGRLIYIKGAHLALKAFAAASRKVPNITLKIIGDGMERRSLEDLAQREGLIDRVAFLGNVEREVVLGEMSESDIFLFPSFEGGGMVVLEAMAAGLPVVCLDYGGPGQIVTDECGIKVKPLNPEQTITHLADALLKLASDPELRKRMAEAGKKRVEQCYTWQRKKNFIQELYARVLAQ